MASLSGNAAREEADAKSAEGQVNAEGSSSQDEKQAIGPSSATSRSESFSQERPSPSHEQPPVTASQGQSSSTATMDSGLPWLFVPQFERMSYPWTFDPSAIRANPEALPWNGVRLDQAGLFPPMLPIMCPAPYPGILQAPSQEDQQLRGGGIFAVPMVPVIGPIAGFPPGGLIPFSYNLPPSIPLSGNGAMPGTVPAAPRPTDSERAMPPEAQDGPGAGLHHRPPPAPARAGQVQRQEGQRQIVRRFHVGFQIDLLLILKLAVVVYVFNQDGSRDRLLLLLLLAGLVYLYQTGALTPLLQWISQSAQRAMMPPQQPQLGRAPPRDMQVREARGNVENENAAANVPAADAGAAAAAAAAVQDPLVAPAGGGGAGEATRGQVRQPAPQVPTWWGFFKELQMLVVGFVTSLLPGFQHVD